MEEAGADSVRVLAEPIPWCKAVNPWTVYNSLLLCYCRSAEEERHKAGLGSVFISGALQMRAGLAQRSNSDLLLPSHILSFVSEYYSPLQQQCSTSPSQ